MLDGGLDSNMYVNMDGYLCLENFLKYFLSQNPTTIFTDPTSRTQTLGYTQINFFIEGIK